MSTETYQFETETKQLLDLMIHSLYSNKEIFLRELISNASDALDKIRFEGVSNAELLPQDELHVFLEADPEARTLTVMDNGIGMSRAEVVDNIGTIARSGTRDFMASVKAADGDLASELSGADLIGQFGVGFYSSFLVADRVSLVTRKAGEDTATQWESTGDGSYSIGDGERREAGTTITLHLKPVDEDDGIEDYTAPYVITRIVKRYSDFVAHAVKMMVERQEPVLGADGKPVEGEAPRLVREVKTINSQKAIWTREISEVDESELKEFYHHISHDWSPHLTHVSTQIEGSFEARALLFVPSKAPFDLYHRDMKRRGIQLYVKRVFIMDEATDLLPEHLRFIKGVVDAEDLSLNVSRELLQQDRQVRAIRKHLVKKVHDTLHALQKDNRNQYSQFWTEFGPVLKEGLLDHDKKPDRLLDLVLAHSTHSEGEMTTLAEYVERMKEGQDAIYVMTAPALESARNSPHLEAFQAKGIEVLLLTDSVDEVWLQTGLTFSDHPLKSVGTGEVELGTEEERETEAKAREELEGKLGGLLTALRTGVQDDIKEVRLSARLTESAACLVTEAGGITPQMEMLMRQSGQPMPKVKRILEVNPKHELIEGLEALWSKDPSSDEIGQMGKLLYGQAVLAEGGQLADPAEFARLVAQVMTRAVV